MSALQFLREKAGVLVAGFIGLSLFIFVVSDFFGKGRSQRLQQRKYYEIGLISGERVSYQDYEQRIQNLEEIYKLTGSSNIDEATLETIREQIWQQLIRERILESKYKNLGIGVSTEELNDLVLGNDPHPVVRQLFTDRQTGQFNRSFLVNFLKSIDVDETSKKYWLFFENEIVSDRMNTKYNTLVSKGLYATSQQAEFEKNLMSRTVDFSYLMKSYSQIPDTAIIVTENELHDYYSNHKESYTRNAERDIEYLTFDITPSEEDFKQAKDWIDRIKVEFSSADDPVQFINTTADTRYSGYYVPFSEVDDSLKSFVRQENRQEVYGPYLEDGTYKIAKLIDVSERPDSVHARHILITPSGNVSMSHAVQEADSLVSLIKNGASFATIAQENSDDQGSAQAGGDLGWFKEGMMVAPFNNVCFTAKKGELNVVQTNYGVHIVEVLDQSRKIKKYDVGIVDRKVEPGNLTNQKIYGEASQFAGNNDTYEKFTKTVAEQKLNIRVANNITPQQKTLPGLDRPRLLIMSLFQAGENKIILDANKQAVFEIGDKYVVAYCTKVTEQGTAPFKDVESDVRFNVLKDKKADLISSELQNLETNDKTLDQIATDVGVQVQEATQVNFRSYSIPGAGIEPSLIAAATVAEQGVVAGPVKGNNGVFLLTVNNFTTASDEDLKLLQERLTSTLQMRATYEAYDALMKQAKVVDKRYKFY
jgi:peptidyl-prolyl cis-trans isomerase D